LREQLPLPSGEPLFPEGSRAVVPLICAGTISAVTIFLWSEPGSRWAGFFSARALGGLEGLFVPGLLTHVFAHGDLAHLGFNMVALIAMGAGVVRHFGVVAFFVAMFLGAVIGAGAELLLSAGPVELVGASTSVSALFAMALLSLNARRSLLARAGMIMGLVALFMVIDLTLNISGFLGNSSVAMVGHAAGFLTGAILTLVVPERPRLTVTGY
jgi:membrane associated rhomboid family serine protease